MKRASVRVMFVVRQRIHSFIQEERGNQIDKPNTETIAYMDLFSQLEIQRETFASGDSLTEQYTSHPWCCPRNTNWRYGDQPRSSA